MSIIKREKRTIILLLIEIAIPIICLIGIPLGTSMYILRDYKDSVIDESYWALDLPSRKEMKKVLKEHTEYGPHGEGLRHSIYTVERSEIELQFRVDSDEDIEDMCLGYCEKLETEKEYFPDFAQEYRWRKYEKYQDTLILLYFVETNQLHVFEDIF